MSEERAEARASSAGLYVGERTLSLIFAAKPSSSTLTANARTIGGRNTLMVGEKTYV